MKWLLLNQFYGTILDRSLESRDFVLDLVVSSQVQLVSVLVSGILSLETTSLVSQTPVSYSLIEVGEVL